MKRSLGWPGKASISRLFAGIVAFLLLLPALGTRPAAAQQGDDPGPEVVIFVLDLSGSMNEPFDAGQTKLEAAKAAFSEAFANISPDALVGLRTYGDQIAPTSPENRQASCSTDTRLVTPVAALQRDALIREVQGFSALGDTPMGLALQAASGDIPAGAKGTIVLFSDGRDECFDADLDGDPAAGPSFGEEPCAIARGLLDGSSGVERVVTVGFATDETAAAELQCIANATAGAYTAIETAADARDILPELLVELSAPREAERLAGREIVGSEEIETAPDLQDLGLVGASRLLYTDTIEMNSERVYRVPNFQPGGGTLTATVFGLPPEPDLIFDLRLYSTRLDREFFQGDHGDTDAGLPERSSASIRCTGCAVGDREGEVFWIISLETDNRDVKGTYEIELLIEGPGFGGPETTCRAPQACYYGAAIDAATAERDALQAELSQASGELATESLLAERDSIRAETDAAQAIVETTNLRSQDLEARIAAAPQRSTSWRLPMLMVALGAILALVPLQKLRRRKEPKPNDDSTGPGPADGSDSQAAIPDPNMLAIGPGPVVTEPEPAVSRSGAHDWDAELDAAKAALAQQRPVHPSEEKQAEPLPQRTLGAKTDAVAPTPAPAAAVANETPKPALRTADVVQAVTPAATTEPAQPAATPAPEPTTEAAAEPATEPVKPEAAQQEAKSNGQPAGWYQDPAGKSAFRWWDGTSWTEHTNDGNQGGAS